MMLLEAILGLSPGWHELDDGRWVLLLLRNKRLEPVRISDKVDAEQFPTQTKKLTVDVLDQLMGRMQKPEAEKDYF